jgi:hypothetical protein
VPLKIRLHDGFCACTRPKKKKQPDNNSHVFTLSGFFVFSQNVISQAGGEVYAFQWLVVA